MASYNNGRFFPVIGLHLGATGAFSTFNESTLSNSGIGPFLGQLGMVIEADNKVYRLVKFDNGAAVASAAGTPAYWSDRSSYVVTSDASASESGINGVAGGFLGVVTDLYYCFIQIGGLQSIVTDGNAVPGSACIGSATDGVFDSMLVGSATWLAHPVGISNSTDVATAGTMYWLLGSML